MYTLAALHHLRQRLGLAAADTTEDLKLLRLLQTASAQIERLSGRRFSPRLATLEHDVNVFQASELLLRDDLLALASVTNGDGQTIDPAQILTIPDMGGDTPTAVLRLTGGAAFVWQETPLRAVRVRGVWGWHDRWSRAWRDSGDSVQNNPLSSGATSVSVSDSDGVDGEGELPRFQAGQMLQIEDEYLRVTGVNTTTNTLTVLRGVNGTTAAAHDQHSAIAIYQAPLDVQSLVVRWAAWLYKEADARAFTPAALVKELDSLRRVGVG